MSEINHDNQGFEETVKSTETSGFKMEFWMKLKNFPKKIWIALLLLFLFSVPFCFKSKDRKQTILENPAWREKFLEVTEAFRNKDYEVLKEMIFTQFPEDLPEAYKADIVKDLINNPEMYRTTSISYYPYHPKRMLEKSEIKKLLKDDSFLKGKVEIIRLEEPDTGTGFEKVQVIFRKIDGTVSAADFFHVTSPSEFQLKNSTDNKERYLFRLFLSTNALSYNRNNLDFFKIFYGWWILAY